MLFNGPNCNNTIYIFKKTYRVRQILNKKNIETFNFTRLSVKHSRKTESFNIFYPLWILKNIIFFAKGKI